MRMSSFASRRHLRLEDEDDPRELRNVAKRAGRGPARTARAAWRAAAASLSGRALAAPRRSTQRNNAALGPTCEPFALRSGRMKWQRKSAFGRAAGPNARLSREAVVGQKDVTARLRTGGAKPTVPGEAVQLAEPASPRGLAPALRLPNMRGSKAAEAPRCEPFENCSDGMCEARRLVFGPRGGAISTSPRSRVGSLIAVGSRRRPTGATSSMTPSPAAFSAAPLRVR
jgi:hypothetical protein